MKSRPRSPSRRKSSVPSAALWTRVAQDHATMLWSAGEVIGRRTAAMAAHGLTPNARERTELRTMVEEKQTAMFEGSVAAWAEMIALQQASWLDAMRLTMQGSLALVPAFAPPAGRSNGSQRWVSPLDTQLRVVDAAFRPSRERVAANRKRLGA